MTNKILVGTMALRSASGDFLPALPIYREEAEETNKNDTVDDTALAEFTRYMCERMSKIRSLSGKDVK